MNQHLKKELSKLYFDFVTSKLSVLKEKDILKINVKDALKILSIGVEEHKVLLPYCGKIFHDRCYAIRKNHCLYTQCNNSYEKGKNHYCSVCYNASLNSPSEKPPYGDIRERDQLKKENRLKNLIPYANIMDKLNIKREDAENYASKLGLTIDESDFEMKIQKRGRPKKKKEMSEIVYDTDDEEIPKKRGRPKKKKLKKEEIDMIELLAEEMSMSM